MNAELPIIKQVKPYLHVLEMDNKDEIVIGDYEASSFTPQILLSRWKECLLKLDFGFTQKIKFGNTTLNKTENKLQIEIRHPLTDKTIAEILLYPTEKTELGALEFEIKIYTPKIFELLGNKLVFPIETKKLKFYYQPPLTEELNPQEYDELTETYAKKNGQILVYRPPEVVGSYAVYHATKSNIHRTKSEAEKYKTGKAFHIYRPKIIDSKGKEAWCALNINEKLGILTITVPDEFLKEATYPITIDPTFGYTEVGGSSFSINKLGATKFDCPESGTAESMTFYWNIWDTGKKARMGIYNDDGGSPSYPSSLVASTELQSSNTEGSPHWETLNFTGSPNLSAQTYWLAFQADWGSINYDTGDTNQTVHGWISQDENLTMPDPYPSGQDYYDYKCSIYCTYTAGATQITVTDSVSLSDSILRHKTLSISDSIGVSDSILGHKTLSIADAIQSLDQILRDKSLIISDSISVSDLINVIKEILKTVTDTIGLSDQILTHKTFTVSDQISVSDTVQIIQIIKTVLDTISVLDQILTHKQLTVQDQIKLSEIITLLGQAIKLVKILIESFIPIKILMTNTGYVDKALSFDGTDDYIVISDSSSLSSYENTDELTVMGWFKLETIPSAWTCLIGKPQAQAGFNLHYDSTQKIWIWLGISGTRKCVLAYNYPALVGNWTHIAFTVKNGTTILYINGVQVKTATHDTDLTDAGKPLYINSGSAYWCGIADEIRIYNRALTESEIQHLYNHKNDVSITDGLVLYLPLNGNVQDYSGQNNHGTIHGDPTWINLPFTKIKVISTQFHPIKIECEKVIE